MNQRFTTDERRQAQRFSMRIPVTLLSDDRQVPAFTKDVSARGIYFYVSFADSALINQDLDFIIEFPPEITLCASLRVRCKGKVLRKVSTAQYETGVAAEIYRYAFMNAAEQS